MNYLILAILIIIERSLGVSFILLPLVTVLLFKFEAHQLPKFSLILGLIIDILSGFNLGISSILLLVSSLEVSWYKSKIESSNFGSVFLLSLLISVQAHIIWGIPANISKYLLHALISVVIYFIFKNRSGKNRDGVYLRG